MTSAPFTEDAPRQFEAPVGSTPVPPDEGPRGRTFVLTMLGIAPLDLGFTGAYIAVSGRWEAALLAVLLNLSILGAVNALGAYLLFRPIRGMHAGDARTRHRARRRLGRLGLLAPAWAFALGVVYCGAIFLAGPYTDGIDGVAPAVPAGLAASAYAWFAFVYGFYFAFYAYFATSDTIARYRRHHPEDDIPVLRQPFALKLALVAVALAAMPPALILQDLTWLAPIRAAQSLTPTDAVLLDLMATMLAAGLSLFFVGRSLLSPVTSLVGGFDAVAGGRLDVRLVPASDDELGELAQRFNRMVDGLAERRRLEGMFSKYVAPAVARSILADSEDGHIRGDARAATNLFADIEGFTALSEDLDADRAIDMLNDYFEHISAPVTAHGGAIVNLTGDGLHAVFNVPHRCDNHAEAAVRAALEIQALLAETRFGPGADIQLRTRIGIHTGRVVAGSVGCDDRLHYTVYGDSVNVAARLEALNKELGTETLLSEAVRAELAATPGAEDLIAPDRLRPFNSVTLRGRRMPMRVYAVDPPAPHRPRREGAGAGSTAAAGHRLTGTPPRNI